MRLLFDSFEALLLQVGHTRDFPLDASGHGYCNFFLVSTKIARRYFFGQKSLCSSSIFQKDLDTFKINLFLLSLSGKI
jgi:hypothetical protein